MKVITWIASCCMLCANVCASQKMGHDVLTQAQAKQLQKLHGTLKRHSASEHDKVLSNAHNGHIQHMILRTNNIVRGNA